MKLIGPFIFSLLLARYCEAQKILIPYRSGKLFGVCDDKGNVVTKPAYDFVYWMHGSWFKTTKKVELKDTLETAPQKFYIRNTTATVSGLINNGKVVLDNEPFDKYEIIPGKCIVAKYEGRATDLTKEQYKKYGDKKKFISLFNADGKNLYPANFKMIRKVDTAGSRYILFWTINMEDKHSLFVFDSDKQEISDWFVRDAFKLSPTIDKRPPQQVLFVATDSNMKYSTYLIDYSKGKFLLEPATTATNNNNNNNNISRENNKKREDIVEMVAIDNDMSNAVVEMPAGEPSSMKPAPFNAFYSRIHDSLYYAASSSSRKRVALPGGSKIIFMEPLGMTQYQPVIVKNEKQFFIVGTEQAGITVYDSLIYFGQYFLAWKKINGVTKAGVISSNDSVIIPFKYDSLYAGIRYFNLVNKTPASRTAHYQIGFKEADSKYNYKENPYNRNFTNHFTVFENGHCGVITIKGDTVIPFQYQMIARNGLEHSLPRQDNFVLLQQNGHYGITSLIYEKGKKHEVMSATIAPVYDYIPGFYYADYYGVKNFRLIGLYNDQYEFMGYANEKGKVFYKEE